MKFCKATVLCRKEGKPDPTIRLHTMNDILDYMGTIESDYDDEVEDKDYIEEKWEDNDEESDFDTPKVNKFNFLKLKFVFLP